MKLTDICNRLGVSREDILELAIDEAKRLCFERLGLKPNEKRLVKQVLKRMEKEAVKSLPIPTQRIEIRVEKIYR